MEAVNQEARPEASTVSLMIPEKRKRGRPRKDPSERRAAKARSQAARMPPGYPHHHPTTTTAPRVDPIHNPTEVMIGQTVTGVVEATFEAGYLLAVRIGNSNITLRGAVFKPGHTAPVTPANDVAPHVEMIKRAHVPFPETQPPIRRRKRRSKEKNMQLVTYVENQNQTPPNYVFTPVVLQPNGPGPVQGKPVHSVLPLAVYPPNNGSTGQGSENVNVNVNVAVKEDGQQAEGLTKSTVGQEEERVVKTETDIGDMNEPLFVEPLQTRHTVHHFQGAPVVGQVMGQVMHTGTGRMTELLQAVQQNMGDDQVPRNGHQSGNFMVNRNRDEETGQQGQHQEGRQ